VTNQVAPSTGSEEPLVGVGARRGRTPAAVGLAVVATVAPIFLWLTVMAYGIRVEPGAWGLGLAGVAFGLVGAAIIVRVPGNRLGWVFGGIALATTLSGFQTFARPLFEAGLNPSLVALGQVLADAAFFTMLYLVLAITPSWFPTGRPVTRRWGWSNIPATIAWLAVLGMALFAPETKILWDDALEAPDAWRTLANPLGVDGVPNHETSTLAALATLVILGAAVVAVASLVVRYRRAEVVERTQIRSLMISFLFLIPAIVVAAIVGESSTGVAAVVFELLFGVAILLVPVAAGIAILRYRLYEIDVVVSKAVTFSVLGVFITGVYAVVVVGVGSWVGGGSDVVLSVVAVAIVAVLFEPVRVRVAHWANVLVYGERATPYEVLAGVTERLSASSDPDVVLGEVTRLVVEGTGASEAVVWLAVGDVLHPRASWPSEVVDGLEPVGFVEDVSSVIPGDRVVAIRHHGEVLGALSMVKGRGDSVSGADEKVLADVAAGAGVLVRNIGLNAELEERAEQLRVSRRRLVAAQDAERHRLERDLHDGAQQQVVALKVKLGIARTLAEREGADQVAGLVASLSETTQEAVDGMRAVAHGIYPPLLESDGLEAALGAARRTVPIPVEIGTAALGRFGRPMEETVYFAAVGSLAQAVNGGATSATISLSCGEGMVEFVVLHDGQPGDLSAVRDRVEAFGGELNVTRGTGKVTVTGILPVAIVADVA
jgi:signal transduction histidine kinase